MAASSSGIKRISLDRDDDGHRTLNATYLVRALVTEGPLTVMAASGLPATGSTWNGASKFTESDAWMFCTPYCKVSPQVTDEETTAWLVEKRFTTNPTKRCQDAAIENPLSEPDRIGGSFVKYTREATLDRFGKRITNSAFEQFRGASVERDYNRPTVSIEKNLATLPLSTFAPMIDTLNDATLWGLPARCIKLSNVSWTRKVYGTCTYYYTVGYEFDIDNNTFDRDVLDEGTRHLAPGGSVGNPRHYVAYRDPVLGDAGRCILDGSGGLWDGTTGSAGEIHIEFYAESNFLTLGIPSSLTA